MIWRTSPCDLYFFNKNDEKKMRGRTETLYEKLNSMNDLPNPHDFIEAVRSGNISAEAFEQHGAALAFQWIYGREKDAKMKQEDEAIKHTAKQAAHDVLLAKQNLATAQAKIQRRKDRRAAGQPLDDGDLAGGFEPTYDPFEECHPGMAHLAWDEGILETLRIPLSVEPKTPQPLGKSRPKGDETAFYITKAQIFDGVFALQNKEVEKDGPGIETLTGLMTAELL